MRHKVAVVLLVAVAASLLAGCGDPVSQANKDATAKRFDNLNKQGKGDPASR